MAQDLSNISRDAARLMAGYVGGSFFSFSSVNRRLLGYFQQERQAALKKVKILVKENGGSSFLLTFEGKLYACGQNKDDHFGLGDKKEKLPRDMKCYRQWTRIGPPDRKISEVILDDENSVFVRCGNEWFGAGSHPYIRQAQRRDKSNSPWVSIAGPEPFSIMELIPTATSIFIRCRDNFSYAYGWDKPTSSKIYWEKIGPSQKKTEKMVICGGRVFLQCSDSWYGCGENKNGELGLGYCSAWEKWIKLGPKGKTAIALTANDLNTVIYCSDGYWYGCGQNMSGQLGTGNKDTQFSWNILGPEGKEIQSVFLEKEKIFVCCVDGLYACGNNKKGVFGTDDYENRSNWTNVGFANKTIFEIIGTKYATFVRCSDGWYVSGDNQKGVFGAGDKMDWLAWEKLSCGGKEILRVVPSNKYTFVCCDDAWYFTGSNVKGSNGMDDPRYSRTRWIKVLNHGEEIETVLALVALNKENIKNETKSERFRRALKKLYELDIIGWLEDSVAEIANSEISICYHEAYPDKLAVYFLLPRDGWGMIDGGSEEEEFYSRLPEILDYPSFKILMEPNPYRENPNYYSVGWGPWNLSPPDLLVRVCRENYEAICHVLKTYEDRLDQEELIVSAPTYSQMKK